MAVRKALVDIAAVALSGPKACSAAAVSALCQATEDKDATVRARVLGAMASGAEALWAVQLKTCSAVQRIGKEGEMQDGCGAHITAANAGADVPHSSEVATVVPQIPLAAHTSAGAISENNAAAAAGLQRNDHPMGRGTSCQASEPVLTAAVFLGPRLFDRSKTARQRALQLLHVLLSCEVPSGAGQHSSPAHDAARRIKQQLFTRCLPLLCSLLQAPEGSALYYEQCQQLSRELLLQSTCYMAERELFGFLMGSSCHGVGGGEVPCQLIASSSNAGAAASPAAVDASCDVYRPNCEASHSHAIPSATFPAGGAALNGVALKSLLAVVVPGDVAATYDVWASHLARCSDGQVSHERLVDLFN